MKRLDLHKWTQVLVVLYNVPDKDRYCERLIREVHVSMSHLRQIIKHLEKEKLIFRKDGNRTKYIELTREGESLAHKFLDIYTNDRWNFRKRIG